MQNKLIGIYKAFLVLLVLNFIGIIATLIFNDTIIFDELEHLRASYFVSQGEMPYRDFFEHHHPLIWFTFAPIISILPHNIVLTLYAANIFAFVFSIGSTFLIFKIAQKFLGGAFSAILTLVFYFMYFTTWYSFSIFKPDTFMRFFYLLGLYNFFIYYDKKKTKNLIISASSFTISFLYLQTIIFSILPLAIPFIYMIYKNKFIWKDLAKAGIIPIIIILSVVIWFYLSGTWNRYFELNWIYNSYLFDVIHSKTPSILPVFSIEIIVAYISMAFIYFYKEQNNIFNIISLLFVCECIQRVIFPAVYPHYLVLLLLFSSFIIGYTLNMVNRKWIFKVLFIILIIASILNFITIYITNGKTTRNYLKEFDKNPNASTINFDVSYFNVYAPKYSYYWFYPNFEYVDNSMFNTLPDYDINEIIRKHKPIYIAYNSKIKQNFNMKKIAEKYNIQDYFYKHSLDLKLLEDYKEILPNLYKRN
jgi:hypothetical protein